MDVTEVDLRARISPPFDLGDLVEIIFGLYTGERAGGTVLFAAVGGCLATWWIERRPSAEIALDCQQFLGGFNRFWKRLRLDLYELHQTLALCFGRRGLWRTLHHRDCIVGTVDRAIAATDAGLRIDIQLVVGKSAGRTSRAASETFGVLAMQANHRSQQRLAGG